MWGTKTKQDKTCVRFLTVLEELCVTPVLKLHVYKDRLPLSLLTYCRPLQQGSHIFTKIELLRFSLSERSINTAASDMPFIIFGRVLSKNVKTLCQQLACQVHPHQPKLSSDHGAIQNEKIDSIVPTFCLSWERCHHVKIKIALVEQFADLVCRAVAGAICGFGL